MNEPFFIRLRGEKTKSSLSLGADDRRESLFAVLPPGVKTGEAFLRKANAFLIPEEGDCCAALLDDGGNVLFRFKGTDGTNDSEGSQAFPLFLLGPFLWGGATEDGMMRVDHVQNLSRAGAEVVVAHCRAEPCRLDVLRAVARTRAAENKIYFILTTAAEPPSIFGPSGEELPSRKVPGGAEYLLERENLPPLLR